MAGINDSVTQNLLPVQAYFNLDGTFNTFIGQGQPFYATFNPVQSGLTITNSTIDSTTIGATSPSTGVFTNITTTTGQISTTPSGSTDIANKYYVDTVAQGLGPKAACQVATTANITLSGLQTIDGYTTLAGDRVLVKNQTLSQYNGIYIASASAWTRSTDMDVWSEVPGAYTVILNGGQSDTGWVCTATQTGTINVTAMPWVQFSGSAVYTAGTGLTLSSNQFSITNTGVTSGSYGSSSNTLLATVNAQGQLTSLSATAIAISNSQVSGLGTMSTQNANSVAITGGSINGTTIGGSTASAVTGTTITATSSFSGSGSGLTGTASGLSIGGNAATATSATSAGSVTNSITFNNSGSGSASGSTFNGASALTVSYNTVGAPSTTGTNASGNWGISITGNAGTVTNGVYTTGSYSNPSWITSILGSIVSGAVASATTATNVAGGATGSLLYQSASSTTTSLALGTTNYVLTAGASAPQYVAQSTLSVGSASTATTATNLAGGVASQIPYQSVAGTTAFIANGTSGQFLQSNGTGAPTWATPTSYATVTDDTTTNSTRYPLFANQTSGNLSTEYTSSTKLQYNPSTGVFTSTSFSGAGTGLTGTASSLSIGGNAATATSATSATTATNLAGGATGSLPYQSSANTTTFLAAGTNGYVLTLAGGVPTWAAAASSGITITDNTSSSSTYYPTLTTATSGTITSENTSSTKLSFVPSTGTLTATKFVGDGSGLTGVAGGTSWQSVQTSNFTAVAGNGYPVNTTSAAITVTLPASPAAGNYVVITDYARTWATNAVTINPNGGKIQASTSNITLNISGQSISLVYIDSTQGWLAYTNSVTQLSNYTASYLAVAGGAGGGCGASTQGGGGGGGGGGFVTGSTTLNSGVAYTITVGAGGAGGSSSAGVAGGNSSIGSLVNAIGGGSGGNGNGGGNYTGGNGGSGGGGAGSSYAGGSPTSGQGSSGGSGGASPSYPGGGGGGASAAGGNASGTNGGAGGAGTASTISGSSITYAGGGGGGIYVTGTGAGAGGAGGGGNGGNTGGGGAGTANTGGGGGGAAYYGGTSYNGSSGGSGIVIISYAGSQRGTGGTVTSVGGNTIHTFTSSGTYTA